MEACYASGCAGGQALIDEITAKDPPIEGDWKLHSVWIEHLWGSAAENWVAQDAAGRILTPNETEALALLGRPLDDHCPGAQLAAELRSRSGARNVIVTLGANGLAGFDADGTWEMAAPKARVVNTTGAGDA